MDTHQYMKKLTLIILLISATFCSYAQGQLAFPFQGGKDVMTRFFKDSLTVTPEIKALKASGAAVFKFTADENGAIKKIIIFYADDIQLTPPIIEALKRSNGKWIIPDRQKLHDFIITFNIKLTPPATASAALQKAVYNFNINRKPVVTLDQVPLDEATLLPAVIVNYTLSK
ncbi:hypothetical protein [Mucilaginibacter antarcticus]|uniref:TonB C-terminal domain-containing protein n=1 Tax=Mucilaginibacter antarcticus TaxID=1855725 RepID=A0ABW5XJX1_9SPHI